jgi:uncharacterized protein (TIGR02677 family)
MADRYSTFGHLTADKHALYRGILTIFASAKARFVLHLRPAEVRSELPGGPELDEVQAALRQLVDWGNLSADADTAEVATIAEFYRARFLYRLTPEGEATERALQVFEDTLVRPGELQTAALIDIRNLLHELAEHAAAVDPDAGKVHLTLRELRARFDELTDRAQTFVASLQRTVDLHDIDLEDFLAYKDVLIGYLERFVGELVVAQANIAATLRALDELGIDRLLAIVAYREVSDALDTGPDAEAIALDGWRARWDGLRGWFLTRDGHPAQAEVLRSRARSAIPALLLAISEVNERRVSRSDRTADLRSLARWFAACDSDADAHRLWRAAFALSPARHLTVDDDTLVARDQAPVPAATSWLDAPPVVISPRLRRTGHYTRRGRISDVIDRTAEKRYLAELAAAEAAQLAAARAQLLTDGATRLSDLSELDPLAFELLLDLLGEALSSKVSADEAVTTTSSDGSLAIELTPTGDGRRATIRTAAGELTGPDHVVRIHDAFTTVIP